MSNNLRSTISIVLIAAALFGSAFIWYRFFTASPPAPVVGLASNGNAEVGSKSLLLLLESLESLKLDLGVLDAPLYKSLQDFTPNILLPETKGRTNPFAPLR